MVYGPYIRYALETCTRDIRDWNLFMEQHGGPAADEIQKSRHNSPVAFKGPF